MNQAIQTFIAENSRIAQSYFSFTEQVLGLVSNSPNHHQILLQLLTQTESVTQKFLDTHQQLLLGESLRLSRDGATTPLKEAGQSPLAPLRHDAEKADAGDEMERWLRHKLAEMTGFAATEMDLTQTFDRLGLDSLGRLDLQEAITQRFPNAVHASLFEVDTPATLLAALSQPEKNSPQAFSAEQAIR